MLVSRLRLSVRVVLRRSTWNWLIMIVLVLSLGPVGICRLRFPTGRVSGRIRRLLRLLLTLRVRNLRLMLSLRRLSFILVGLVLAVWVWKFWCFEVGVVLAYFGVVVAWSVGPLSCVCGVYLRFGVIVSSFTGENGNGDLSAFFGW